MGIPDWPNRSRRQRSLPNPAEYLPPFVLPILSGTAAFSSVLAASTFVHLKALGISTGSLPPIPTCLGITSVGLASIFSQWVSVKTHEVVHKMGKDNRRQKRDTNLLDVQSVISSLTNAHTLRV